MTGTTGLQLLDEIRPTPTATHSDGWPAPLGDAVFQGLAGTLVRLIEPQTEADPAALLIQMLVAFGNVVGRNPHFSVEADRHGMNLYVVLVGETAKGRKGTSWGHVKRSFRPDSDRPQVGNQNDDSWSDRIVQGLSSGEGLINRVRDAMPLPNGVMDPGVTEKRLIVIETEFASTLQVLRRQGNTLSPVIRSAWDGGVLQVLTRNSPLRASGAHINIIGHITRHELKTGLTRTEAGNGFANRFLWACVRRSKLLPEGGQVPDAELAPLRGQLDEAVSFARADANEMKRDNEARARWYDVYGDLSEGKPGLFGAVTARAEAQVMRLACVYALLDQSTVIQLEHLEAALAVWRYCEDSARYIFGDTIGDPVADAILDKLRGSSGGMTRTEIRDFFGRNKSANEIDPALQLLEGLGRARRVVELADRGGRATERWFAS